MIFVDGLGAPETPRLLPDQSWLVVEMAPHRGGVTRISADGSHVELIARTGTPNGLCPAYDGTIWVAETHPHPALMRVTLAGAAEVFVDRWGGAGFLLPNDLCFGPDGLLYLTDSGILMAEWAPGGALRDDWATAPFDGKVFRIDTATGHVDALDRGLKFPNGIAIGPDGLLYVNEMITGAVYRYDLGGRPRRETFGNVLRPDWDGGFRGPDGMAFGADGRLYCTVYGQADVTVLGHDGEVVDRIATEGTAPTNVAFGPGGEHRIYVTEHELGRIEVFDVPTPGLPLHDGRSTRGARARAAT